MHLPHYAVTDNSDAVRVLARQPIDMSKPHLFTQKEHGIQHVPLDASRGDRAGDVLFADSTIFSTLFGADESLHNLLAKPCDGEVRPPSG